MRIWLLLAATVAIVPAAARAQRVVAHDTLSSKTPHGPHLRLLRSDEGCDDSIACTLDSCGVDATGRHMPLNELCEAGEAA